MMSVYTVAEIIAKRGSERDRLAVVTEERSATYGELADRAERLAAGLASAGFRKGDRLCVLMHNRLEWHEILFALARLGGVLVPANHLLTPREIQHIVTDSGAAWFVAEQQLWDRVAGLRSQLSAEPTFVSVGADQPHATPFETLFGDAPLATRPAVTADDLLVLQYTSGTTGFPKGAIHTHSTVMWNAFPQRQEFHVDRSSVYLCLPALSWVAGFHSLHLQTLWSAGTVVMHPTDRPFDPARFCELVERHHVTSVALVPTVMRRLLSLPTLDRHDLSSLRIAIVGGEPVPVHLMDEMNRRLPDVSVLQVYGMTEFPSLLTLLDPADAAAKRGSVGTPNAVSQVRVVGPDDRDLPPGEIGEILTRSPATTLGYYGLPDATAAVLRGGWLHTGDLGHLDGDGYLYISGRSKDVIISGGLNIYPAEVEHLLARHDAVAEVAVIGEPDDAWGEVPKAIVVLADGATVTVAELEAYLEPQLARFKTPRRWEIRTGPPLPRTASGKLQKFKLREPPPR
jgi:fatty-acyl-CoA synthase